MIGLESTLNWQNKFTAIQNATKTTAVANPPTTYLGRNFPNKPFVRKPISGKSTIA